MQRIAYSKKIICYLFILCIALTSTFSANGECGVFSMQRQQTYCSKQTVQVDIFSECKSRALFTYDTNFFCQGRLSD